MGTQRVQIKGVLHWLLRWACRAGTRDFCSALGCSSRPYIKYIFLHHTLFQCLCPHRPCSQLGRQPCRVACPLVCVSGDTVRMWRAQSIVHPPLHINRFNVTPDTLPSPSNVGLLFTHSPILIILVTLRRIAFALTSTFLNGLVRSYFIAAILPIQTPSYLHTQD